jgi:hypothetical protein
VVEEFLNNFGQSPDFSKVKKNYERYGATPWPVKHCWKLWFVDKRRYLQKLTPRKRLVWRFEYVFNSEIKPITRGIE